jgi:hypothetical protein
VVFILEVFGYILSYRQAFVMLSMAFLYQYEWIMSVKFKHKLESVMMPYTVHKNAQKRGKQLMTACLFTKSSILLFALHYALFSHLVNL